MIFSTVQTASTIVDDATVGGLPWVSPGNAAASDDSDATASGGMVGGITHYLKATGWTPAIPVDAAPCGIKLRIERAATTATTINDNVVSLVLDDGSIGTANKATATKWPATDAYASYGDETDLWDETLTAAELNHANSGVVLSATITGFGNNALVDHVERTVYWRYPKRLAAEFRQQLNVDSEFRQQLNIDGEF